MKILLIGANGQLGTDLNKVCQAAGDTVVPVTHAQLDVTNDEQVAKTLADHQPDVVINTAAYHKVEECEKKSALAFEVNATAPMKLAQACKQSGAILVHFSTDYVFGGYQHSTPFAETDRPAPQSVYGTSKLAGECLIPSHTDRYFILRVCGLYGVAGSSGKGGNFVETMLKKAANGDAIKVVADQIMTPTYTADLARAVRALIPTEKFGLYHLSSDGECSWHEFTQHIFKSAGIDANLSPCKTSDFYSPVQRPAYSVLSKAKFRSLGLTIPTWRDALPRYLEERSKKIAPAPVESAPAR
jgi:dTDP-4-dehydrorhamnose reductase